MDGTWMDAGVVMERLDWRAFPIPGCKVGVFAMQIIQVCTLGLMQKQWEAYFAAEHP